MQLNLLKKTSLTCFLTLLVLGSMAQTNTTTGGLWTTGGNWDSGVPTSSEVANINHAMTLNTDISITTGGNYTITSPGAIVDPVGGTEYDFDMSGSAELTVNGPLSIGGDFSTSNNSVLTIQSGDTLVVRGDMEFRNFSDITVETGAVLIVTGDLSTRNFVNFVVNGQVAVGGGVVTRNSSSISGSGNIQAEDGITTNNSSSIFGNTGNCPAPCETGSGQGLPITLSHLEANFIAEGQVLVKWETVAEINNEFYTLYYSYNGYDYTEAIRLTGAGNSAQILNYEYLLTGIQAELLYVQLQQTDFDGKTVFFRPVVAKLRNLSKEQAESLSIYPNPSNGENVSIAIKDIEAGQYRIRILNLQGQVVSEESMTLDRDYAEFDRPLANKQKLNAGIYFLSIENDQVKLQEKLIVQ